jgi:glutathionylspermidine synthase
MYGRFDFSFQEGTPKLLEFNADTPTCLVEASVAQWFWFQDKFGEGPDVEKVSRMRK